MVKWKNIKSLSCLKKGRALSKKQAKYIAKGLHAAQGGDRKSQTLDRSKIPFAQWAAEKLLINQETIRRYIKRWEILNAKTQKHIVGTWIEDNGVALAYLGRQPPEVQIALAKAAKKYPLIRPLPRLLKFIS
ncbi:MAG: hypothetical protein ACTINM_03230 [Acetobacter cibinongensis]